MPFAVAAGIGAAGSIAGGAMSASAANKASQQQQANIQQGVNAINANQAQIQQNYQPTLNFEQQQLGNYGNTLSTYNTPYTNAQYEQSPLYTPQVTNLAQLEATPGYQIQLQQGEQAINNSAAAQGGLLSGANLMALNNYAQNQASTGFQNAWQRAQTAYNSAFSNNLQQNNQIVGNAYNAANLGQTGLQNYSQLSQANANSIASLYGEKGQAAASGTLGQASAINTGLGNTSSAIANGVSSYADNGGFLF
jgi:hypothetical protein